MKNLDLLNFSEQHSSSIYQHLFDLCQTIGLSGQHAHIATAVGLLLALFLLLFALDYVLRNVFYSLLNRIVGKTTTKWDDFVLDNKVHVHLSRTMLLVLSRQVLPVIFLGFPVFTAAVIKFLSLLILLSVYNLANS